MLNKCVVTAEGALLVPMSVDEEAATRAEWAANDAATAQAKLLPPPTPAEKLMKVTGMTLAEIKAALV